MHREIEQFSVGLSHSIQSVLGKLDKSGLGIVLVIDNEGHLLGTITDGDVRRALLAKLELTTLVSIILERKAGTRYSKPLTAGECDDPSEYLKILKENDILHLPILNSAKRLIGLVTMDDFVSSFLDVKAVVMAGGRGTRLHPLTESLPKPMLPVGDKPLLEVIINRLKQAGVRHVHVTTHHKKEKITEHFGDGGGFGVELQYVSEERPLGTAGSLGLMAPPRETLLVINGDILTDVDFKAMMAFHREHKADFTVAVRQFDFQVPYGVLECEGERVTRLQEKPICKFLVNAGIYLLEPGIFEYLGNGKRQDMTDLIHTLLKNKKSVISFPVHEAWIDIGTYQEYQLAQKKI